MTLGCNIWMICLKLNWLFYDMSHFINFEWELNKENLIKETQNTWLVCSIMLRLHSVAVIFEDNFLLLC